MPPRGGRRRSPPQSEGSFPFGRAADDARGQLMDAGCPNCCGVLAVEELGEDGMLLFRCRVGHTYNEQSLLEAKEEQLETSLWTTIEIFEELVSLHEEFAKRALGTRQAALAREYQRRAREAAQQLKRMREIVASDGPPAGLPRERHNGDPS